MSIDSLHLEIHSEGSEAEHSPSPCNEEVAEEASQEAGQEAGKEVGQEAAEESA